jgi:nucleotide-binding universal stress UspA family protein
MSRDPIVAGTDGSAGAEFAVDRAGELAGALDVPVHVVCVHAASSVGERMAAMGGVAISDRGDAEQAQTAGERIVAHARQRLEPRGLTVHSHVRAGDPAQSLVAIAEDEQAQMIVVGSRGMTGARRILGSVPNSISHRAACGVLIVQTGARSRERGASLLSGPIVVGTDGSSSAQAAVKEAIRLAKALGSELHVASGYKRLSGARVSGAQGSGEGWGPLPPSMVESVLDEAGANARVNGIAVATHAFEGDPSDALMDVAAKADAGMIVVGSRGMHGAERIRLGNVPNQISHRGQHNVLIVLTGAPNGPGRAEPTS